MKSLLILLTIIATPPAITKPATPSIAVIGASASAGWGVVVPHTSVNEQAPGLHHRHVHLGDVLKAITKPSSITVHSHASSLFFQDPVEHGTAQVDAAIANQSDVVVALDFLFWHTYGPTNTATNEDELRARLQRLEVGLAQLNRLSSPVIVGDIPDMRSATEAWPLPLLQSHQVPTEAVLAAINRHLKTWADARPNVTLISLHDLTEHIRDGQTLTFGARTWPITARFVQADGLHPTAEGLCTLAVIAADATAAASSHIDPPPPDLSQQDVFKSLQPANGTMERQ